MTPTRINPYGTRALNRNIQSEFRGQRHDDPNINSWGDEQFVPGDKVIQNSNERRYAPHVDSYNYVANGEIGVVVETRPGNEWNQIFAQFSTQSAQLAYSRGDVRSDPKLELAYGLTVHKAQGSEFDTVVLILPQDAPTLSRELLYTGLTRYRDQLILLVEKDTSRLYELSKPENSDIRRRNTRLFTPSVRTDDDVPYPENLIHRTKDGTVVRSKSEVVIADTLRELDISYEYEKKLSPENTDEHRWPDFTIQHQGGKVFYWEHLGMLHNPEYRKKWERKKQWYEDHGLADQLVTSRDTPEGGIDSGEIEEIARQEVLEGS